MLNYEDSPSVFQRESEDREKLLFSDLPPKEREKRNEALGKFCVNDDSSNLLLQKELKIDTGAGPCQNDKFKIESQAVPDNQSTNDTRLSNDRSHKDHKNYHKLRMLRHSTVHYTDNGTPESVDSQIFFQDRVSSKNHLLNNVSESLSPSPSAESNLSFVSDATSQSASSNQPSIATGTASVHSIISGVETPLSDESKTPTTFHVYKHPKSGRVDDSEVLSSSTNKHKSWERRSCTDLSLQVTVSSHRLTRSLPLLKDVQDSMSGGLRSTLGSPIRRIAKKLPSSVQEQNNISKPHCKSVLNRKPLKKCKSKNLGRSRKPYEFLTTGTPLLRLCKRKPPDWRHFEVDTDLEYLIWYDDRKFIKQTRIPLVDIEDIVLGQGTPGFHKCPRSQLTHQSFSIKYKRKKYLDLICLTYRDCQMWYYGLQQVVNNIREGYKWRRMSNIQIPHKHEKSKNAIYPAKDGETWIKYVKYLKRSKYRIQQLLKQSEELLNFSCTLSMRKRLKAQFKQLNIWIEDTETTDYLLETQYNELRAMRVEIWVLQYKVAALLREKLSRGSVLPRIVQFCSSSGTPPSSSAKYTGPLFRKQQSSGYSRVIHNTALSQGRGSCLGQIQAAPAGGMINDFGLLNIIKKSITV